MIITRKVKKYGTSWVIVLDPQSRAMLGITEIGQNVDLKKSDAEIVEGVANDSSSY